MVCWFCSWYGEWWSVLIFLTYTYKHTWIVIRFDLSISVSGLHQTNDKQDLKQRTGTRIKYESSSMVCIKFLFLICELKSTKTNVAINFSYGSSIVFHLHRHLSSCTCFCLLIFICVPELLIVMLLFCVLACVSSDVSQ